MRMYSRCAAMSHSARPSRIGGPSRDLKTETRDLAFRMARANYPSELIYAALSGLRAGWVAHTPVAACDRLTVKPTAASPAAQSRRPRRGGRPSQERRSARRLEVRVKQLAAEKEAEQEAARKAQVALEQEAERQQEAARKAQLALEHEADHLRGARRRQDAARKAQLALEQDAEHLRGAQDALEQAKRLLVQNATERAQNSLRRDGNPGKGREALDVLAQEAADLRGAQAERFLVQAATEHAQNALRQDGNSGMSRATLDVLAKALILRSGQLEPPPKLLKRVALAAKYILTKAIKERSPVSLVELIDQLQQVDTSILGSTDPLRVNSL